MPDIVKGSVTIDGIRLKSYLKILQTLILSEKSFFRTILGFIRSRSYPLEDIEGFHHIIAEFCKIEKPVNITGIEKINLKCDCINGSIVNGNREPILYYFALSSPPGRKKHKEPRIKLLKKEN